MIAKKDFDMFPTRMLNLMFFLIIFSTALVKAEAYLPKSIMMMDEKYTHHSIIVEKSTHRLFLYANNSGSPRLVSSFLITTGKITGDKLIEGDNKTPEGFYQLNQFFPSEQLLKTYGDYGKIYGPGAFVINYPNIIDRLQGKTGGGIWLHSTDDETRISKGLDSRGCVVLGDKDLKEIARYIDLETKTPIIIEDSITYWSESTWLKNREQISRTLQDWIANWSSTNIKNYLSFYHRSEFRDQKGMNYNTWADHKERVFKSAKGTSVKMEYPSIFLHNNYAYISFQQNYTSSLVKDTGRKIMIWKKDVDYNWKIIYEGWESIAAVSQLAFTPSQRFFR